VPIVGTQRALDRAGRVAVAIDELAAEIVTRICRGADMIVCLDQMARAREAASILG
jgi:hypothetical protein